MSQKPRPRQLEPRGAAAERLELHPQLPGEAQNVVLIPDEHPEARLWAI